MDEPKKVYLLEDIIRTTTYGKTNNRKLTKLRQLKKEVDFYPIFWSFLALTENYNIYLQNKPKNLNGSFVFD